MTIDYIALQALSDRGIDLNPPVSSGILDSFCSQFPFRIGRDFKSVYRMFNGFMTHDAASMLMLWDIEKITASRHLSDRDLQSGRSVAIGDYLIDSDVMVANISDEAAKVSLLFEQRELASSIEEFIDLLVAGTFDFI